MRSIALVSLALTACSFSGHGYDQPGSGPDAAGAGSVPQPDAAPFDTCASDGDDDGDAVCNAVDDWPCGERPTAPGPKTFEVNSNQTILALSEIELDDRDQLVIVDRLALVSLRFAYAITDTACSADCIDQIEYGLFPQRMGCAFDGRVDSDDGVRGDTSLTFLAPDVTAPTRFELRATIAQNYGCYFGNAQTWYGGVAPDADHTIAYVCVR